MMLTKLMVCLMSRSGQSSGVMVAVSMGPPRRTWITAGLIPANLGPLWRKECPIILPAIKKRSESRTTCDADGIRWSLWPSKRSVTWPMPALDQYCEKVYF